MVTKCPQTTPEVPFCATLSLDDWTEDACHRAVIDSRWIVSCTARCLAPGMSAVQALVEESDDQHGSPREQVLHGNRAGAMPERQEAR